ncbi:MAG: glycoside hydrolase family 3 protein, partial [Leptospiraceae bacterium]|nr:glycoside hydrolase family 3 protein [Leptospiraceae bacterium]
MLAPFSLFSKFSKKFFSSFFFFFLLSFQCNLCSKDLSYEASIKIDKIAREIVSKMTDEEKAGQVIHVAIPGKEINKDAIKEIETIKPGGIILFGLNMGSANEISKLNSDLQVEARKNNLLPLFISADQEGGRVIRVKEGVTLFPGAMSIGQTGKKEYSHAVGFLTSYQLNNLGINVVFAPSLDINNNPDNPVINTRSYGSDLDTVSIMGSEYEIGARQGGALPVIKHFPGHGDTNVDSHLGLPVIQKSLEEISEFELIPFQKSIQGGAKAVMSAHIVFPKIDPDFPATLSPKILRNILREKFQFSGIVFTDAMEMHAISKNYKDVKRGNIAILAGADIILMTSHGETTLEYYNMVLDGIKNNEFKQGEINLLDEAVVRQVKLKIEMGLFSGLDPVYNIQDELVLKYIYENKKAREEKFKKYELDGIEELNKKISLESIRSYKEKFIPIKEENLQDYYFLIRNKRLAKFLNQKKVRFLSKKSLKKISRKSKGLKLVFDSNEQNDINKIARLLKKANVSECIILHYGSPFLNFKAIPNKKVLFSFSPTPMSLSALVEKSIGGKEDILPANLIFKDEALMKDIKYDVIKLKENKKS